MPNALCRRVELAAMITAMGGVQADDVNYCGDPAANQQWAEMLAKSPDDPHLIKLVALRAGLCALVDQGRLSVEQATEIFEAERLEAVIRRRKQEEQKHNATLPRI